ncbi:MAG: peptide chain release factor N(5)-glutamine methyltransferase [Gammaproteobacteria bacterium]|nr:peptide chain release factor N(5)-glutamine methyltransferase [Gammaproteobacteria bacterium]
MCANVTFGELVGWGYRALAAASSTPRLDTELLLATVTGRPRSAVLGFPEATVSAPNCDHFCSLIQERRGGVPLAYLTGHKEFYSLELSVTRDTLVPRPETELLVDLALTHLTQNSDAKLLDLGTGCGAIALALKRERPGVCVTAVDSSRAALRVARRNAARLALDVRWLESRWFDALNGDQYDLIVANPPYVASSDPCLTSELRHEPRDALDGGADGLQAIRRILAGARAHLQSRGYVMIEHGYDQGPAVAALARDNRFRCPQIQQDLNGQDRVLVARAP